MTSNLEGPHRIELPLLVHGRGNHKNCRWACGNQCFHEVPNRSDNETFTAVVERALSRRVRSPRRWLPKGDRQGR